MKLALDTPVVHKKIQVVQEQKDKSVKDSVFPALNYHMERKILETHLHQTQTVCSGRQKVWDFVRETLGNQEIVVLDYFPEDYFDHFH